METAKHPPSKFCTSTGPINRAAGQCDGTKDPIDFSSDERFQRMMNDVFDLAKFYHVEPEFVINVLDAAIEEGDQR